jgi:ABC-type polysaccharide/polyol phosphate export permease
MSSSAVLRLREDVVSMLGEQVRYREVLLAMVRRDLLLRYKQAALGFGWAVLVPLLHMIVFTVVFTRVVLLETEFPYPIYAYTGLLPWALFASAVRFSAGSLVANRDLITKIFFPREVFVFSAVIVALVDFLVASLVLLALMAYYGVGLSWSVLFVPVIVGVQLAFTTGIGLLVAMANLFYRDVRYLVDVLLTAWMFGTSVVYPVERIGGRLAEILVLVNPMTPIINAYRSVVLGGSLPDLAALAPAAGLAVGVLAVGWLVFHRGEFRFAEEV